MQLSAIPIPRRDRADTHPTIRSRLGMGMLGHVRCGPYRGDQLVMSVLKTNVLSPDFRKRRALIFIISC
jgi:hypothetical protein